MGLFSNHKKPCPICGSPTPRLFPTKIEDQPICKECDKKIDLPAGAVDNMTLSDFKQYLAAYAENQALWPLFHTTYRCGFGFSSDDMLLDEDNGLIRLKNNDNSWVIEKRCLQSFRIFEDNRPLFESGSGALLCHPSEIPDRIRALAPVVTQFQYQKREYERQMEREDRLNRGKETDEERRERERVSNMYRPRFDAPDLFREFRVELTFDHPYWPSFENTVNGPSFDENDPSVERYMQHYTEQTDALHTLAVKLMHMIDPAAGESWTGVGASAAALAASAAPAAPVDAVAEIKKYKELLDQGLLTEEEFTAKKRQLLGI